MSKGIVRWFNSTLGAGFIRTDDGKNVLFLKTVVKESDPSLIHAGSKVCVEALESQYGLTATQVKVLENDRVE
jgi:cold shock CspA family protein